MRADTRPYEHWLFGCCAVFVVALAASAVRPHFPRDWWLENTLALALVVVLLATRRVFPFSRLSYSLILVFLLLHELGAHFTYAEVPYREWVPWLNGTGRNHYDRFVHFAFGLLVAYPVREVFLRVVRVRGFWSYYLPLDVTMAFSMLYELIEWGAASWFGGDLGQAYLGTQGDPWDAQEDMAVASLGALVAMIATGVLNRVLGEDVTRDWLDSLREPEPLPLGDDEIRRLAERRRERA